MNIYDVADKAGVSIATVSRVLNGSDKVKPATKQKIEQIIAENGFVKSDPHSRRKSTMCIGYIYTNFRLHASALFVEDVTRSLGIRGYRLFAACTDADFNNLHIAVNQLREHVDCFIIQAGAFAEWPSAERTFLIRLAKEIPLILMDGRIDAPGICDIRYNLSEPITNFIQTLYHKGNRNVLFIFASMSSYCMSLVDSYRHAYELLHYEPESIYTHLCPDVNSTMQYLRELISQEKLPLAVFYKSTSELLQLLQKQALLTLTPESPR